MQYRSKPFEAIAERVTNEYTKPPSHPITAYWFKKIAPKWRNRVGLPRLIAEAAMVEALGLLGSISRAIFRKDQEMREHYDEALEAVDALVTEFSRQNWRRFEGKEENDGE